MRGDGGDDMVCKGCYIVCSLHYSTQDEQMLNKREQEDRAAHQEEMQAPKSPQRIVAEPNVWKAFATKSGGT